MNATTTTRQVTPEMIDRASRWIDNNSHKIFWLVESQSEPGTHYKITWNEQYRVLQCLQHDGRCCPAAEQGKHCYHLDVALAAEIEYQAERRAMRQAQERIEVTTQYQQEQREQAAYTAQINLDQERNATTQCADGSWW